MPSYLWTHAVRKFKRGRGRPRKHFTYAGKKRVKAKRRPFAKFSADPKIYQKKLIDSIEQYKDSFNEICNAAYCGYFDLPFVPITKIGEIIYKKCKVSYPSFSVEMDDIQNMVRIIWYKAMVRFDYYKPLHMDFNAYMSRMICFELSGMLFCTRDYRDNPDKDFYEETFYDDLIPNIDLNFVANGVPSWHPCSVLSSYERYYLYLKFNMDMTFDDMKALTGQDRLTVRLQYYDIVKKLRQAYVSEGAILEGHPGQDCVQHARFGQFAET